jgi:hypothetical protein
MIGVVIFWKGLSFEGDGSSTDGLLCEEPIWKELSLWEGGEVRGWEIDDDEPFPVG